VALSEALTVGALKKSDEIVENLYDRILGRVALFDIEDPNTWRNYCS
jgi:hypothetical protein